MQTRTRNVLFAAGALVIVLLGAYLLRARVRGAERSDAAADAGSVAPPGEDVQWQERPTQAEWQQAAAAIPHVPIDSFPGMPELVRFAFAAYRCAVPQPFTAGKPANVISGSFAAPGQTDWAALCTRGDSAAIMIVWGGPANCPTPMGAAANASFLQTVGEGAIGFSREIRSADVQYIREHAEAYGGPRPPSTNHDGIEDAFVEKASIIHYCYAGQWLGLQGAD